MHSFRNQTNGFLSREKDRFGRGMKELCRIMKMCQILGVSMFISLSTFAQTIELYSYICVFCKLFLNKIDF